MTRYVAGEVIRHFTCWCYVSCNWLSSGDNACKIY